MYEDILLAVLVIVAFIFVVRLADRKGWIKKYGMKAYGPFLMWSTQRGKDLIERLARPKRFWLVYAAAAKWVCLVVMFLMMALLLWEATIVPMIPASSAPSPEMILGIPGINPIIPLWYGILGLVVAIFIHEFAHGILTRVGGMAIRSMGVLLLIVPMGAFVEPDEEALVKADKRRRMNVYAVGPATNIIVGLVFALIFSMAFLGSVEPVRENPIIVSVASDGPADLAGLQFGAQVISLDGVPILSYEDYRDFEGPEPGEPVDLTYYYKGEMGIAQLTAGVYLTAVSSGYPAANAGLERGMIIHSLNGTVIRNDGDLSEALRLTVPGQTVDLVALSYDSVQDAYVVDPSVSSVTVMSRQEYYGSQGYEEYGFLGINSAYMGAAVNTPEIILDRLSTPYKGADDFGSVVTASLQYIAMPFSGLAPIQEPVTDLFEVRGVLGALPDGLFWVLANSAYWIFWINLMVGMTNVLPAVPLDGGYLFRDGLDSLVRRVKKGATDEERMRYVGTITYTLALLVLFLILWQLIGPRLLG